LDEVEAAEFVDSLNVIRMGMGVKHSIHAWNFGSKGLSA
jgi:hypothetical protein